MNWAMTGFAIAMIAVMDLTSARAGEPNLDGGIAAIEPWLGTWQVEADWSDGSTLWAQSEYRPLLGGAFVEGRTFVRDNNGPMYQRYRAIFAWDAEHGGIVAHVFGHDGSYTASEYSTEGRLATTSWPMGELVIDESVEVSADGGSMRWLVWGTPIGRERAQMMDATWRRVDADPIELPGPQQLMTGLAALDPLLGGWESVASGSDGEPPWSRTEYRVGLAGRFVDATTWATDDDDAWYPRNEMVFVDDADPDGLSLIDFAADGGARREKVVVSAGERGAVLEIGGGTSARLRQRIDLESATACRWRAWERESPDTEWRQQHDAEWRRQGSPDGVREPIDPDRFVASGGELRSFVKEGTVPAPRDAVWAAWTDPATWQRLWGPTTRGRFDLAVGGAYEWLFNGEIGGNGDQILSYVPGRMLSFSWNAPPSQPVTRLARTWVVVELEEQGDDATRVRLTHLGFGEGPEWDETYAYFDAAWERVLALMATKLAPPSGS